MMTLAEKIRKYVFDEVIEPARRRGQSSVEIIAEDVHSAMDLKNRMPAVCGALDASIFLENAEVKVDERSGPKQGSQAKWVLNLGVKQPDTQKYSRLLVAKHIYQQAIQQSEYIHSQSHRLLALIGLDLAVETFLKVAIWELDPGQKADSNFNNLLILVDKGLSNRGQTGLPNKDKVKRMRELRNAAQHEARYPSELELRESLIYARDFLNESSTLIWKMAFDSISLVGSVQNSKVRDLLLEAEGLFNKGDYPRAIQKANLGISRMIEKLQSKFDSTTISYPQNGGIFYPGSFSINGTFFAGEIEEMIETKLPDNDFLKATIKAIYNSISDAEIFASMVNTTISEIQESLLIISLGLNLSDWLRFRKSISHRVEEESEIPARLSKIPSTEADWIFHYILDSIIEIEHRIGEITLP